LPRIIYIVTVPETAFAFLRGQFKTLLSNGYDVNLISSPGPRLDALQRDMAIKTYPIAMERRISPLLDLISLLRILIIIRKVRPTVVNYSTPKAGLLGAIAAWLAHVPIRVYELRGLRLETEVGLKRFVLEISERFTSFCSTNVVCVSRSLLSIYRGMKLSRPEKLTVFGKGLYHGVDMSTIIKKPVDFTITQALNQELNIPDGAKVIGYVGRLTRDKGIEDLFICFLDAVNNETKRILLLVGQIERGDPLPIGLIEKLRKHPDIRLVGVKEDVVPYYQIMDVFAFPSYREGLPNAPLEAAFAGVPTVGYAATGIIDAVVDGETGLLVAVGCIDELRKGIIQLLENDNLRKTLGANAREYALREFSPERSRSAWLDFYSGRISRVR
jgi:glycosyltransferase involved in cell wall biosynthesis